ncbi:hypothetical protein C7I85_23130 [Mesorhizobium soli]|uniref:Uncharacterized protein n=1 Tax=Pseudaminobacter soli (ex Li et al. 2025) TaxID=1295366 RepID=A0A2P7S3R4_9HYPH|nr:hypothetical protein C7I85_23130 [Mesorhizobium soli]
MREQVARHVGDSAPARMAKVRLADGALLIEERDGHDGLPAGGMRLSSDLQKRGGVRKIPKESKLDKLRPPQGVESEQ